jgi:hypothetical protein
MDPDPIRETILETVEACLDAQLRAVPKFRSASSKDAIPAAAPSTKGRSQLDMAFDILKEAGRPFHIGELLERIHAAIDTGGVTPELLALDAQVTDCNSALFDVAHDFHGCIAGCHEVLRRQGLLEGIWCLDRSEGLSPGQASELDRVCSDYPHLIDDAFVARHRERWLA